MAFNPAPSAWLSSWAEDGTTVSFDLADLSDELTAAEADASTGDWRDCIKSLIEHTYSYFNGLATADKPAKLTLSKVVEAESASQLKVTYTVVTYVDLGTVDVSAEL